MTHKRVLIALAFCLALAPLAVAAAEGAERDFVLDGRVTLQAYRSAVEARLEGLLVVTRTLAATEEVRSGRTPRAWT